MKKLMLFSMWLVASAAAVAVAWAGVSVVDNQVVDPPSAAELAAPSSDGASRASDGPNEPAGGGEAGVQSGEARTSAASPSTQGPTGSPTTKPVPGSQPASRPAPAATSETAPTTQAAPATQATQAAPATQATSTTAVPTTPPPTVAPASTTQTFALTGGTAAISFSASGVEVLWATPNPGFSVEIEPESPGIKVEFRADHHRSRLDAWWSGGPQRSIREEPRD